MSRPTVREVADFLAGLNARRDSEPATFAELMERKADLLERIAADLPGDTKTAEVAARARARANQLKANG
ncbi:hypothetical protein NGB36_28530 [Streptomyces sp. RB6PN25]|uniref:Uncharacterized protein n=1 Tax=Streptomyces humicola TaxID=2953240 RepID=A0ABT1Q3B8_9ACTN|nr:hypothetical protein [Streptomyces humicola]MCQ4084420.1 hypothetical protein [Streptomyces humicola]